MVDWRLTLAWLCATGLGSVSMAGLAQSTDTWSVDPVAAPVAAMASSPPAPILTSGAGLARSIHVRRSDDGLFYINARVNDVPVRFLIDTGASHVVLSAQDALRVGVSSTSARDDAVDGVSLTTAGGTTAARWQALRRIALPGADVADVKALVLSNDIPVSLIGQNLLSRLGAMTIDGDTLTIGKSSR